MIFLNSDRNPAENQHFDIKTDPIPTDAQKTSRWAFGITHIQSGPTRKPGPRIGHNTPYRSGPKAQKCVECEYRSRRSVHSIFYCKFQSPPAIKPHARVRSRSSGILSKIDRKQYPLCKHPHSQAANKMYYNFKYI
jgi:hypothetical protein